MFEICADGASWSSGIKGYRFGTASTHAFFRVQGAAWE